MDLLLPGRFERAATAYGYQRVIFEQVATGARGPAISITPSTRHLGVTRRDTFRTGFPDAVRAARKAGYPVLVRSSGGGATAAHHGTFGFSLVRPAAGSESGCAVRDRYDEAAALVLGAFARLGVRDAAVGEVRDEFCPGDHSIRVGSWKTGVKVVGIAQRLTRRATSVGGIVIVEGEEELARILERVYAAMRLPFRSESVGSLRRAGCKAGLEEVIGAFAAEAALRYGAVRVPLDGRTLASARNAGEAQLVRC